MEIFRIELQGIWQFGILEAQNSEFVFFFFFWGGLLSVFFFESLSLFFLFIFYFLFFYDQQLAFENNEIRFQNN